MKAWTCLAALMVVLAAPVGAQRPAAPPTPLFASDQPIHITIQGPISSLASKRAGGAQAATMSVAGGPTFPITLAPRGITRLRKDTCQFPPLRVDFTQRPPAGSLFEGQRRLKLVTHCRQSVDFQQKVLLEYSAYRLYNLMTPLSFRARLAQVDYVDSDGKPFVSRVGFFLEDFDDVAKRNGMTAARMGSLVPLAQIDPTGGARFAVFEYMISNYDWSMRAGPAGEACCHNGRLLAGAPGALLIPVPYDFDFSGLVDAPYSGVPEGVPVESVRERTYRGYCAHVNQARAAAADASGRRGQLLGVFSSIPGLDARNQARATSFINGFFVDVDSGKIFRNCVR